MLYPQGQQFLSVLYAGVFLPSRIVLVTMAQGKKKIIFHFKEAIGDLGEGSKFRGEDHIPKGYAITG